MKIKIICFLFGCFLLGCFLLGCPLFASAQQQPTAPPQIDAIRSRYVNMVEYINCKLTEFSVNAAKDPKLTAGFMQTCHCSTDGGTDANLQRFYKANSLSRNARIFRMTDSLKNAYKAGMSAEEMAATLTGYLASARLSQFASNKPDFPAFTQSLSAEIDKRFPGSEGQIPTLTGDTPSHIADATEVKASAWSRFFTYLVTFLLGAMLGAATLRYYTLQRAKERRVSRTGDTVHSAHSTLLEQQITDLQAELERRTTLNMQLKMRLDELIVVQPQAAKKVQFDLAVANEVPAKAVVIEEDLAAAPIAQTPEQPRSFFVRMPTRDGLFNHLRKSDLFLPNESVYVFEIIAPDCANFSLVSDADMQQLALDNHATYLQPACDYNPHLADTATHIYMISPGIAIKEGDVWRVTDKAIIDLV